MKAVFLDFASLGPGLDASALHALLPELTIFDVTEPSDVAKRIAGAEIVLTNKVRIGDPLMQTNPLLRYIGLTATGTDNIDLDAAKRHDVTVKNIRAYCTESVAEHVFACLLSLTRSLHPISDSVKAGEWQRSDGFCLLNHPIRELSAMTMGIVGYGELGRGVAKIAEAFGMDVLVSARIGSETTDDGRIAFDELLRRADVISLHCPLNEATRNLLSAEQFKTMKRTAIVVNTARGGLIDSAALADALRSGEIAAAAIDVLPEEPPINGDPLLDYSGENLIVTPHVAWATNEARQAAVDQLTEKIAAFVADTIDGDS